MLLALKVDSFLNILEHGDCQFESRSGPTFCWSCPGSKLFVKVISIQRKVLLADQQL